MKKLLLILILCSVAFAGARSMQARHYHRRADYALVKANYHQKRSQFWHEKAAEYRRRARYYEKMSRY